MAQTDDAQIASRIRGIFQQISPLNKVRVSASAGVVTLEGTVPTAGDVDRVEAIAARVSGVVTVENKVTRDLTVNTNLSPAGGGFWQAIRQVLRALPLVGVALTAALLIALVGYLIAGRQKFWRMISPNAFLAGLIATAIRFVFFIFGLVVALKIIGATALLGAVLGGAGVIGLALGFAVRDTVGNYISSLMLSLRQPFRPNEHVVIDEHEGRVIRLTSRATILMTLDGNHLRIPNSMVYKAVILNYSRNPSRRFHFDLGVDADDNSVAAIATGLQALNSLDFVVDDPNPNGIIQEVGDSNVVIRYFGWVDQRQTDFLKGRSLAIQAVKTALETAGFALPEPIYRLRFDETMQTTVTASAEKPRPQPETRGGQGVSNDSGPDPDVARMVEQERADSDGEDLLSEKCASE
ncbi:MAG: mechanosensitive ion channel domain-containing protein [Sphingomicrobium sp.]